MRGTDGVMGIKPWDIGAGGLLVREAGGRATSTEGDEEFVSTGTIVVSNGLLHEQMLRVTHKSGAPFIPLYARPSQSQYGQSLLGLYGSIRNLARRLLECLRFYRTPAGAFETARLQIRLDSS